MKETASGPSRGESGTEAGARNIISGNIGRGIEIKPIGNAQPTHNEVRGNYIGTDLNGTGNLGNGLWGIFLIGGSGQIVADNVISGNGFRGSGFHGIEILLGGAHQVTGNIIGLTATGNAPLGNRRDGIHISFSFSSSNNTIGGTAPGEGNVIAFNGGDGVAIGPATIDGFGVDIGLGTGNAILGNSIFDNGGLGIDLVPNGVTPNDPGDGDTGPNNLQNFPVLTSTLSVGGNTTIEGTLNSTANTPFTVELFSNTVADASGFGEGETFLGATTVTTDAGGNGSFSVMFATAVPGGQFITATATDPAGNTSEFSAAVLVVSNQPPTAVDDSYTTDEDTLLSILVSAGVLFNDSDVDAGDTLAVSAVNGVAANVGTQITLSSGALLTLNADGSLTYDPNGQFEALAVGASATNSFTYTVTDSQSGGTLHYPTLHYGKH